MIALMLAAAIGFVTVPVAAQEAILVLRHAEKVDDSHDPPLSSAGEERALALARHLRDAGVDAIYSTGFIRTMKTATPLAAQLDLDVSTEPEHDIDALAIPEYNRELVARLRRMHANDVVLIVGHSNSVPGLLQALGHPEAITIASEEYDNLFLVIPRSDGPPSLLRLRY